MQEAYLNSQTTFHWHWSECISQYFSTCNPPYCRWCFQISLDRHLSSPFFLVLWYSPSYSMWFCFTWMLPERLSVGEGGVFARVLTALFWNCITESSERVQSESGKSSTISLEVPAQFLQELYRQERRHHGPIEWLAKRNKTTYCRTRDEASWHRARYELALIVIQLIFLSVSTATIKNNYVSVITVRGLDYNSWYVCIYSIPLEAGYSVVHTTRCRRFNEWSLTADFGGGLQWQVLCPTTCKIPQDSIAVSSLWIVY